MNCHFYQLAEFQDGLRIFSIIIEVFIYEKFLALSEYRPGQANLQFSYCDRHAEISGFDNQSDFM